jgi:hypothetical protein
VAIERNWTGFEGGANDLAIQAAPFYATVVRNGTARSGQYFLRHVMPAPASYTAEGSLLRRVNGAIGAALSPGDHAQTVLRVFLRLQAPVGADGCTLCGVGAGVGLSGQLVLDPTGLFSARAAATRGASSTAALAVGRWYRVDLTLDVTAVTGSSGACTVTIAVYTAAGVLLEQVTSTGTAGCAATLPDGCTLGHCSPYFAFAYAADFDDVFWCAGDGADLPLDFPAATRIFGVVPSGQGTFADWANDWSGVAERPRGPLISYGDVITSGSQWSATTGARTTFVHAPVTAQIAAIDGLVVRAGLRGNPEGTDALLVDGDEYPVIGRQVQLYDDAANTVSAVAYGPWSLEAFDALEFGARNLRGAELSLDNIYLEVLGSARAPRLRRDGLQIHDTVGDAPSTAMCRVGDQRPVVGQPIQIGLEADTLRLAATIAGGPAAPGSFDPDAPLLFDGVIQSVDQDYEGLLTQVAWSCTAVDHVYALNARRPFGSFDGVAAHVVIETIMGTYAPAFTLDFVQLIAVPITIVFDGTDEMAACLSRIAAQLGACHWYLDGHALHFFHVGHNDGDPEPVSLLPPAPSPLSAVSSGAPQIGLVVSGWCHFSLTYVYDDGRESQASEILFIDVPGPSDTLDFTVPVGPDYFGHPVVRRYLYQFDPANTFGIQNMLIPIPDNVSTVFRLNGAGTVPYIARRPPRHYEPAPAPLAACTIALSTGNTGACSRTSGNVSYAVAFVYSTGVLSAIGAWSNIIHLAGSDDLLTITDLPIGVPNVDGAPVVYRVIYQAFSAHPAGVPFDPSSPFASVYGQFLVPDNTALTVERDLSAFNDLTPVHPAFFFPYVDYTPRRTVLPPSYGPSLEVDLTQPDPLVDGSPTLLYEDPPLRSSEDASQVRTRVFVKGAGRPLTTATVSASNSFEVDGTIFDGEGGLVVVGEAVFAYTSISGGRLWLPSGSTVGRAWPVGTVVSLWVQCDDLDAQAELGDREAVDGVPTDGIRDYVITDAALDSVARCLDRGYAELVLFARPILTVTYGTRDRKTRAGRRIAINLTDPPLVHPGLLIQEVAIDQIEASPTPTPPRYTVTASSVRFTIGDLIQRVQLIGGG